MPSKDIVFILGYGRCGSSALTRTLSLCGCELPTRVVGPDLGNKKGYWEPVEAVSLNLEFTIYNQKPDTISLYGSPFRQISWSEKESFILKIQDFIRRCGDGSPLLIKEPMINRLTEFWFEAARREGFTVKTVIGIRNPKETAESQRKLLSWIISSLNISMNPCDDVSRDLCTVDWLSTNFETELNSRCLPRVFVDYSMLLKDWRSQVARISTALSIELVPKEFEIENFLSVNLYRQRTSASGPHSHLEQMAHQLYTTFYAAATDGSVDFIGLRELQLSFCQYVSQRNDLLEEARSNLLDTEWIPRFRAYIDRRPIWLKGVDY